MFAAGLGSIIGLLTKVLVVLLIIVSSLSLFFAPLWAIIGFIVAAFVWGMGRYLSDKLQGMSRHRIYR